jgi:Leucine-rich repeat (LRR) protein
MALTNPKLFGLNVRTLLADVESKNTAIQNLGINPLDLEIIKGSTNAGMSRFDWVSFSRLKTPIYRTLDRFNNESNMFTGILLNRAGTDQTLFGNLDINGSLSGSAIRYRYRDFTQSISIGNFNTGYKIADISTSRVSAWSSADPRANNPDLSIQKLAKISYGARVGIVEEGKLEFGSQTAGVSGARLQTTITPEVKEFPSEVPTSRIKCKIGTEIVYLYTMKGIPLVFKGFFRNINASATVDASVTKASWKIVETANENLYTNYVNQGATTSSITYRSPISRERFIKLYKNPNDIQRITIRSANLRELPPTKLINCDLLDFAYNQLKTFPNFSFIAPSLLTLNIMRNPFYLSDIESERTFNTAVLAKIPTTLTTLNMEGTFYGSIERNIISARIPNLVNFSCGRGGGAYFHPDTRSPDGSSAFCPDMPGSVTSYQIQSNDFRSVDNNSQPSFGSNGSYSYKQLPNLVSLNINGNYYLTDNAHSLASANSISTINYSSTGVAIPTGLEGKTNLSSFVSTYNRNSSNISAGRSLLTSGGNYKFAGCSSLGTLHLYSTNLGAVNFPTSFSNPALSYLDLRYTSIKGGAPVPDGNQTHVITNNTFREAVNIRYILIDSGNLGSNFPSGKNIIHPDAFLFNPELYYIWYRSHGKTTGNITQLFSSNPKLQYVWMQSNAFTGTIPNFVANPNIHYVNLQYNQLEGTIPGFKNLNNLRYLYFQNNNLTGIGEPESLPNLYTYQAPNNQLSGQIPDFSGCTNLRSLTLRNNQLTSYKIGAFAKLYRMNFIDLKFNNLTQTDLDNILVDLVDNWTSINRGGVSINLKNQTNSSGVLIFPSAIGYAAARTLVSKGWSIGLSGGIPPEPTEV